MMKRLFQLILLLALFNHMFIPVSAHEAPDPARKGSICFSMDWNGEPLDGGSLTLYRVGNISENDGDYSFVMIEVLHSSGLPLDDLNDPELARKMAQAAEEKSLLGITSPIEKGKAVFDDIKPGLYVVTQSKEETTVGFAPIQPFLIALPKWENDHYVYELTADPKVPLEPQPTETTEPTEPEPTEPTDTKLPQTGQMNWPVPILAVSGLALLIIGWLLRSGKRDDCEI